MSDANVAASAAPAVIDVDSTQALGSLSAADLGTWRATGEMPDPAPAKEAAKDPDALGVAKTASTANAAVTPEKDSAKEAATTDEMPPGISKRQHQINELMRKEAEARLEADFWRNRALKGGQEMPAPAEASKAAPAAPVVDHNDLKPTVAEFEDYDQFTEALAKWTYRQEKRADEAQRVQAAQQTESQKRVSAWHERHTKYAEANPEYLAKAQPLLDVTYPGTLLGDVLLESSAGPQIALYLVENPGEYARLNQLPPPAALRELGKIEAKFDSDTPAPTPASAVTVAQPKTVSDAPAPPVTLGSRPADAADEVLEAVKRGDFRAYASAQNKREIASRK